MLELIVNNESSTLLSLNFKRHIAPKISVTDNRTDAKMTVIRKNFKKAFIRPCPFDALRFMSIFPLTLICITYISQYLLSKIYKK